MHASMKFCIAAVLAAAETCAAYEQTSRPAPPPSSRATEAITEAARALGSPEFAALRQSVARQAAAATKATDSITSNYSADLLKSRQLERHARHMMASHEEIEKKVGPEQIRLAQLTLPGIDQFTSDLKNGKYVSVSSRGPEIIHLIRTLPMREAKDQTGILKRLQIFSAQGYPEAQNFAGNIVEFGLYGNTADSAKAEAYYKLAALQRYQPALFNLALMKYFGKSSRPDVPEASRLFRQAYAIGAESSYRVCGMAAYLEYRSSKPADSMKYANNCRSPLAKIPNALYTPGLNLPDKIKMLKDSISAGANDGFKILADLTRSVPNDTEYLACKYKILDQVRFSPITSNLRDTAKECYFALAPSANLPDGRARSEIAVINIAGFATKELAALTQQRRANKLHPEKSVPYLPFTQADVELFDTIYSRLNQ
jgi:hypothetical protein